jgi:hypothetical protein
MAHKKKKRKDKKRKEMKKKKRYHSEIASVIGVIKHVHESLLH